MPLWRIYVNPNTFTLQQKKDLANAITKQYNILPAFYVNVIFIEVGSDNFWVGGEPDKNFVRITVEQIARALPSADTEEGKKRRTGWMDRINETLRPYILDRKELRWEIHIEETPRDLWRLQGIDPPPPDSEAEKSWKVKNEAHEYH